jgi:site-specific recombinase XerD
MTNTELATVERSPREVIERGRLSDAECAANYLNEIKEESSPHTLRAYAREINRLLLWLEAARHPGLVALAREDINSYSRFLADPPKSLIGEVFAKQRSPATRRYALAVIKRFLDYCVAIEHIARNPARTFRVGRGTRTAASAAERVFDQAMWRALWAVLDRRVDPSGSAFRQTRRRWCVALAYALGLRRSEIASHTMAAFVERDGKWTFYVAGKGGKRASLPVNRWLLREMKRYRSALSLPALPPPNDVAPLVAAERGGGGLAVDALYCMLKDLFTEAAVSIEHEHPHAAARLRQASPHWLRHTCTTHLAQAHASPKVIQQFARHSDIRTTFIYIHAQNEEVRQEAERLNPNIAIDMAEESSNANQVP